jgi:hypothetical protein
VIDKSNEIFNAVATDLRSLYSGIKVVGEYVATPTVFPTVTLDEIQNIPTHLDSGSENKFAEVVYRVQVFSNSPDGKRAQARSIYGAVDAKMQALGLLAVSFSTTPAIYNSEIYSITATYRGVIDRNGVIYRG